MAFGEDFGDILKGTPKVALGIGAVLLAPAIFAGARPLVKALVKGGLYASNKSRAYFSEINEQLGDVVAEARSELHKEDTTSPETKRKGKGQLDKQLHGEEQQMHA
jgi:hypothetical protein